MNNLANDLRPKSLEDIVGQRHVISLFEKVVEQKDTSSFLFYGKPGIGKTTIAKILARELDRPFAIFNASKDTKADLVDIISNNEVIIVDEIHRLNKNLQDVLLSYLEYGQITVYGTTTENPYFIVNPAVRSRLHIIELKPLSVEDIMEGIKTILKKNDIKLKISSKVLKMISLRSSGDFRSALNTIDLVTKLNPDMKELTESKLLEIIPEIQFYSDKSGDGHYDLLSAFHKSLRGSDINAVLYYAACIVKSGDISGLYRRIQAFTYEDIGLANSQMGLKVDAAINAMERLGFPEAYQPLGTILTELTLSPKSNSTYVAMHNAIALVESGNVFSPPAHLKDAHYKSAKKLDRGQGYQYPHNFKNHWVKQQYLPDELKDIELFKHADNANENKIKKYWEEIKK